MLFSVTLVKHLKLLRKSKMSSSLGSNLSPSATRIVSLFSANTYNDSSKKLSEMFFSANNTDAITARDKKIGK